MADPASLAVISNTASTRYLKGGAGLDPLLAGRGDVHHYRIDDVAALPDVMHDCAARKVSAIAVDGGDGTVDLTFAALLDGGYFTTPPALALLPSGKTNMTAAAWSWKGPAQEGLARLLEVHAAGQIAARVHDRAILTVERAGQVPLRGAFFGAADVVAGIHYCRRHIYPVGLPNALSHPAAMAVLMARALKARRDAPEIRLGVDGAAPEAVRECFCLLATSLDPLLLGLSTDPPPDPLSVMTMRAGPAPVLGAVRDVLFRRAVASSRRSGGRLVRAGSTIALAFDGPFTLDGEMFDARADAPLTLHGRDHLPVIDLRGEGR